MKNQKAFYKGYVKSANDDTGKLIGVVGSTAAIDRYGEIVVQETWQLENYLKNPVILWAHNLTFGEDRPPIGKAARVEVKDGNLEFDIQFDMGDEFAADIYRKYKEGFLNAFSVGFIPHDMGKDEDGNYLLLNNELLELSCVPVPANPEALQSLRSKSFAVRSWKTMVKEVEDDQSKHDAELNSVDDDTKPIDKPEDNGNTDSAISNDDMQPQTESTEIVGGEEARSSAPTKPQVETTELMVRIVREATKQLQSALTEYNKNLRK